MTRHAFITGASSGVGRALAGALAGDGWAVSLAARRADLLEEVAAEIEARGGRALACPCDVTDRAGVRAAVARAEEALGPVELLVANAGVDVPMPAAALDASVAERVMEVNLMGTVHAVEAVLPGMLARGRGQLVGVGSLAGYGGLPHGAAYTASKGAQHNFLESLRLDLRGSGVEVTIVTPGHIRTEMVAGLPEDELPSILAADEAARRILRGIRAHRRLVSFPFLLATLTWWGQIVPRWLYDRVAASFTPSGRREGA